MTRDPARLSPVPEYPAIHRPVRHEHAAPDHRITVVMLTHNRRNELRRSLDHMLALPERPRIMVVDNGSTDGTAHCLATDFPGVTLVRAERNLGAAGRNLGVARTQTPYVAFSDDDTWWAPEALHQAATMLDEHPGIAVLCARIVVGPTAHPDPACDIMAASPLEPVPGVGPRLTGFMAGACVMRTPAFLQAGGYWPAFFIGGEEALLAIDILDAGYDIVYAPALTVHHWPSQRRDGTLRRELVTRNAIWTACLRLPWALAWQRTRESLAQAPDHPMRGRIILSTLSSLGVLLANRRLVRADTCALLERVWQDQAR